jgi:elongation factor P
MLVEAVKYITPNTKVMVEFYEEKAIGVDLPTTVDLKVVDTPPGMKGATASGSGKPATLETGLQVTVPQFVEIGEVVRIDTAEGKYLERAK